MLCIQSCSTKLRHDLALIYTQSTGNCSVLVLFTAGGGNAEGGISAAMRPAG